MKCTHSCIFILLLSSSLGDHVCLLKYLDKIFLVSIEFHNSHSLYDILVSNSSLASFGFHSVVFCSTNDDVIALWSKILISIPNSKLLLKNKYLESSYVLKNIIKIFEKNNIYKESLILEGESQNREEFLSTYHKIDICLDPFPFQGNTTSLESLWMGVPVLTLKGDRYIFHFGESINSNIDLIDWIAKNKNDYINKAKHFSSNLAILSKLRNTLRNRMLKSPIFDYSGFVNDFDLMLNWMWNNYLKNK